MLRNIYLKTLRDQRVSFAWWTVGIVALCVFLVAYYPTISRTPAVTEFLEEAPEWMKAFIGENAEDYTSPAGYLQGELFFMMAPILFIIFAVSRGSAAVAGEEGKGTLDILLANPVSRRRVVLEKAAAMFTAVLCLGLVLWASLALGAAGVGMDISAARLAAACLSCVLLALFFGSLALAVGCLTGRRGRAVGVAAAVAVASFFLYSLSSLVEGLKPWSRVSPFYYYIAADPLKNGLNAMHVLVLLAASLALEALSVYLFERRDILV
ncbi:ABC transporter permease subunit [Candidatus Solincola sp.]|nr:ABC transporter permease subunit [Actinomycetota bacterium]MDI7251519.1 ABC transporter permease subunit [Actinomycetota bacterium]